MPKKIKQRNHSERIAEAAPELLDEVYLLRFYLSLAMSSGNTVERIVAEKNLARIDALIKRINGRERRRTHVAVH